MITNACPDPLRHTRRGVQLGSTGSEQAHGFFIDRAQTGESIIAVDSRSVDALPSAAVLTP
jgi:hypothetical protein